MSNRRTQLEIAHDELATAVANFKAARFKHATVRMNKWDATEPNIARRQPTVEREDEGGIYNMTRRLKGANLGRDLERNYSPAKSMIHQFKVNVIGALGKLKVNTEDGAEAAAYFNEDWAKDCDFRTRTHFSTQLQNVLATGIREGDALVLIDDDIIDDSGKMITWEADQVVPLSETLFKKSYPSGYTQDNGIIRDDWGRESAYLSTGKRGLTMIDTAADFHGWSAADAQLFRNPWRLNQGRGTPSLLTPSTNLIDLYEILASELASSKKAAKQYAYVQRSSSVTDFDDPGSAPEFLSENDGRTAEEVAADGANQDTHTARNYEQLEALTGGFTDYIDKEDGVTIPDMKHPNAALEPFIEAVQGYSGAALGLARAYTILRADASYTSFRGDMILTWVTFYWLQKQVERSLADWVAIKVLGWAQRKRIIKTLADGWKRKISWTWPLMPEVDEVDAQNAITQALKNATTNFSELLGPDWEARLESYSEQIKVVRSLGLPLSILEMKSGGAANPKKDGASNA